MAEFKIGDFIIVTKSYSPIKNSTKLTRITDLSNNLIKDEYGRYWLLDEVQYIGSKISKLEKYIYDLL